MATKEPTWIIMRDTFAYRKQIRSIWERFNGKSKGYTRRYREWEEQNIFNWKKYEGNFYLEKEEAFYCYKNYSYSRKIYSNTRDKGLGWIGIQAISLAEKQKKRR